MTVDWWQKPVWRQTWSVARIGSLLSLIPLVAFFSYAKRLQIEQRDEYAGALINYATLLPHQGVVIGAGTTTTPRAHYSFLAAWNTENGKKIWQAKTDGEVCLVSASPNAPLFSIVVTEATGKSHIEIRDALSGRTVRTLPQGAAFWLGDGKVVAVTEPDALSLFSLQAASLQSRRIVLPKSSSIGQLENVPNRPVFLTVRNDLGGHANDAVEVRSLTGGHILRTLRRGKGFYINALPDGKRVAIREEQRKQLALYDIDTGKCLSAVRYDSAFDWKFQVVGNSTGDEPLTILNAGILDTHVSPGTQNLRSSVRWYKWQLKAGILRPTSAYPLYGRFSVSPDGQHLLSLNDGNGSHNPPLVQLRDARNGTMQLPLEGQAGW